VAKHLLPTGNIGILEYGIQTDEILNKKQKNYTAFKFFVSNSK
jgi:hypothetical protein